MIKLPNKKYNIIYADPAWTFKTWSSKGDVKSPKYDLMTIDDIKNMPVADIVEDKKTPSSDGESQGSHTIKMINQLHIKAQLLNVGKLLGGLGDIASEVGSRVLDEVTSPNESEASTVTQSKTKK